MAAQGPIYPEPEWFKELAKNLAPNVCGLDANLFDIYHKVLITVDHEEEIKPKHQDKIKMDNVHLLTELQVRYLGAMIEEVLPQYYPSNLKQDQNLAIAKAITDAIKLFDPNVPTRYDGQDGPKPWDRKAVFNYSESEMIYRNYRVIDDQRREYGYTSDWDEDDVFLPGTVKARAPLSSLDKEVFSPRTTRKKSPSWRHDEGSTPGPRSLRSWQDDEMVVGPGGAVLQSPRNWRNDDGYVPRREEIHSLGSWRDEDVSSSGSMRRKQPRWQKTQSWAHDQVFRPETAHRKPPRTF